MIRKLVAPISVTIVVILICLYLLFPAPTSQAAPNSLPSCGHNSISGSPGIASGPPDIATSTGGANTVVAWSDGVSPASPIGSVYLAYSTAATTDRTWKRIIVDNSLGQNPSVAFDPSNSDLVHVAYQKTTPNTGGNSGISYARCSLSTGACSIKRNVVFGTTAINNSTPQLATLLPAGGGAPVVVVVFQESNAQSGSLLLKYFYIPGQGAGSVSTVYKLTSDAPNIREQNPAVVYQGNRLHIGYSADTNANGVQDQMRYLNLGWSTAGAPLGRFDLEFFNPAAGTADPDFPAIGAAGNSLFLVWELAKAGSSTDYYLVYSRSDNNGQTWFKDASPQVSYRYLPSDNASNVGPVSFLDTRFSSDSDLDPEFIKRLRPAVLVENGTGTVRSHVVWHEDTGNRRDIMYTQFNGMVWTGTPILLYTDDEEVTNVTEVYGDSLAHLSGGNQYHNARPQLLYGMPGNRLQLVYLSQTFSAWEVMYNGWQSGQAGNPNQMLTYKDSDCDAVPDTVELTVPPECENGAFIINSDEVGPPDHYNCNNNFDRLPDLLDTNADGDYLDDYTEWTRNPNPGNPGSSNWRVYDEFLGAFLPLIIKAQ